MTEAIKLTDVLALRAQALAAIQKVNAELATQVAPLVGTLQDCEQFITGSLEQMGPEAVLARKFELEDDIAEMSNPVNDITKTLGASINACKTFMHAHLTTKNLQNMKLVSGPLAFLQNGSSCSVFDWESTLDSIVRVVTPPDGVSQETWDQYLTYIRAQGNWQILKKDVSSTAVKEIVDAKGVPPDGVKYETYKTVQFRRGKEKA